ncbi:MAG: 2-hydroxychromene-2-carboxylate isomerase [Aliishimia sp.]
MQDIEFYYDFASPNVFMVNAVLPKIAAKHGVSVIYKPMLLGGVFKATNNQAPMIAFSGVSHKLDYMRLEIARFLRRYSVPFKMNPHFPVTTVAIMRGAVASLGTEWEQSYFDTVMRALWIDGEKMDDPETIARVLGAAGLPVAEIIEKSQSDSIKSTLRDMTEAAVARKVFGAPSMFVGDEMFFGKDSLDDLDWFLGQSS